MLRYITKLSELETNGRFTKEDLFYWIVDLAQPEFDRLCNEIIALYAFQSKYDGVLVSDEDALLRPFLSILPKVDFSVERYHEHYDKTQFYRVLSYVSDSYVDRVCRELSTLMEYVCEHANTYIINSVSHAVAPGIQFWKVTYHGKPLTKYFSSVISSWSQQGGR